MLTAGRGKIRFPVQRYRPLDYESLPVNSYSIVLAYLLRHSDLFWSTRGEEKNGLTGFQCGADSVLNLYIYIHLYLAGSLVVIARFFRIGKYFLPRGFFHPRGFFTRNEKIEH